MLLIVPLAVSVFTSTEEEAGCLERIHYSTRTSVNAMRAVSGNTRTNKT